MEARLIAYSSPAVIEGLRKASDAGYAFESAVSDWVAAITMTEAQPLAAKDAPGVPRPGEARKSAEETCAEANRLDDQLMDTIRAELHANAGQAPSPPVPLSPSPAKADQGVSRPA